MRAAAQEMRHYFFRAANLVGRDYTMLRRAEIYFRVSPRGMFINALRIVRLAKRLSAISPTHRERKLKSHLVMLRDEASLLAA
jgi:hypothetical protein